MNLAGMSVSMQLIPVVFRYIQMQYTNYIDFFVGKNIIHHKITVFN